ncbi:hypothetical protein lerEdw1_003657 [Lerista edwardsae]|nr:hypothetical protein lerEdw1_003657 [Lerista edwardsae]
MLVHSCANKSPFLVYSVRGSPHEPVTITGLNGSTAGASPTSSIITTPTETCRPASSGKETMRTAESGKRRKAPRLSSPPINGFRLFQDSLCKSERERVMEKQKHVAVWELRKRPPVDWYLPIDEDKPK